MGTVFLLGPVGRLWTQRTGTRSWSVPSVQRCTNRSLLSPIYIAHAFKKSLFANCNPRIKRHSRLRADIKIFLLKNSTRTDMTGRYMAPDWRKDKSVCLVYSGQRTTTHEASQRTQLLPLRPTHQKGKKIKYSNLCCIYNNATQRVLHIYMVESRNEYTINISNC